MSSWRDWLDLPVQGSTFAAGIDQLHGAILATTLLGALVVGGIALGFTLRYRRRAASPFRTAQVQAPVRFEMALIASLTVLFVAWWWVGYRQFRALQQPPAGALDVFVTAKQWMWEFAYLDGRASIAVLVVPADTPIRLIMTSRDVIHGFAVPDFRFKHDVLPGVTTVAWFQATAGIHPIFCTQYCGLDHSRMLGAVVALAPPDYASWHQGDVPALVAEALGQVRDQQPAAMVSRGPPEDLPTQGLAVAARHGCLACHTTDGQRHVGPSWLGLYGSRVALADGRVVTADEAYLTATMMDPAATVVAGYPPSMPSYAGLLEPGEAAALVALITSLRPGAIPPQSLPPLPTTRSAPAPPQPATVPR